MSTATRWGLGLLALLSLNDIAGLALSDGKHPPLAVAAIGAALGVASLVLIVRAWRGEGGLRALLVLRVISAVTALPAFFVGGVPAAALADAIAIVVLTALAVVLLARNGVPAVAR